MEDTDLLNKPINQMTKSEIIMAFALHDRVTQESWERNKNYKNDKSQFLPLIQDRDVLLKEGVFSHADGKTYTNRKQWDAHLKARNLIEVGNDYNNAKPRELRGDFKVSREEIHRAIEEVKTKQKYR